MQKIGFAEALDSIVAADPRYSREAYIFLRDAPEAIAQRMADAGISLESIVQRRHAAKTFGIVPGPAVRPR